MRTVNELRENVANEGVYLHKVRLENESKGFLRFVSHNEDRQHPWRFKNQTFYTKPNFAEMVDCHLGIRTIAEH